jgi:hypothetical protein
MIVDTQFSRIISSHLGTLPITVLVFSPFIQFCPFSVLFQFAVSPKIPIDSATAAACSVMTAASVRLPTTPPPRQPSLL